MKKFLGLMLIAATIATASAGLNQVQQAQVKEWFAQHGPHAIEAGVRDKLATVRSDLAAFYDGLSKPTLLTRKQIDGLSQPERDAYFETIKTSQKEYKDLNRSVLQDLCTRHGLEIIADNHSFVLLLRAKKDWWVIRMRKVGFPIPFQTLSRVAYVHELQQQITDNSLSNIIPPEAYFYNLHGVQTYDENQETTSFKDDNWIVVERYKAGLPTPGVNKLQFETINPNHTTMQQLRQLIDKAGLWDIAANKLFITWERMSDKLVPVVRLVDIEMPGLGGATEQTFFHRNPAEVAGNAQVGHEELAKLMKRPSWLWRYRYELGGVAGGIVLAALWYKFGPRRAAAE